MGAKKQKPKPYLYKTTILVTKSALKNYNRMVNRYSVTTAVTAGVVVLDSLDPAERESWIDRINEMAEADKVAYEKSIKPSDDGQLAQSVVDESLTSEPGKHKKKSATVPKSA
ncbi:MAG: hypothetical protein LLF76_00270 [Planctomycetaceae bacterium]|nr:hypothetical protein [Planctomycetaceae bacterium]